jgi:ribosome-associated translation inhibitor RaiA
MQIQVNAGNGVRVQQDVAARIQGDVEAALSQFADDIGRIEIHLSDENRGKGGSDDKRCLMEARIEGVGPVAVTHFADQLPLAIDGATTKLQKAVRHELSRLRDRHA